MAKWWSVVATLGRARLRPLLAGALSIAVFVLALVVLHRAVGRTDMGQVLAIAASYPPPQLVAALLLALASYGALGGFDWLALHHIRRPLPVPSTLLISFVSHAVSHNAGFAVLTGGSVRLRMYAAFGLGLAEVGGIVAFAGLTFGLGVASLASAAFIAEGDRLAPLLHLPAPLVIGLGWGGAGLLAGYFLWAGLARRPLAIGHWRLATPSLPLALGQITVAAADLALVAGTLYLLLPMEGTGIGYPAFVGLYVVATTIGTLSHVPGGLGVFEGALAILMPAPPAEILAALLVFRVFYNLVPLGLAALVLTVFEVVQRRRHAGQPGWVENLGPGVTAVLSLVCGLALLWPGQAAAAGVPAGLAEVTRLLSAALGAVLLVLPWQLSRQDRRGYRIALGALMAGTVLALLRGPDWIIAAGLGLTLAAMAAAAPLFHRNDDDGEAIPWGWLGAAAALIAAAGWLAWVRAGHGQGSPLPAAQGGMARPLVMAVAAFLAAAWEMRRRRAAR